MVKLFLKNSNLCDHNSPTLQTDRRTVRQTTCNRNTALCTKVHLTVKIIARTQNPLSSQDMPTQMLCGEISRSHLHSLEYYNKYICHLYHVTSLQHYIMLATHTVVQRHTQSSRESSPWYKHKITHNIIQLFTSNNVVT